MVNGRITTRPAARLLHSKYSTNSSMNTPWTWGRQRTRNIRPSELAELPIATDLLLVHSSQLLASRWKRKLRSRVLFCSLWPVRFCSNQLSSQWRVFSPLGWPRCMYSLFIFELQFGSCLLAYLQKQFCATLRQKHVVNQMSFNGVLCPRMSVREGAHTGIKFELML